MLTSRSLPASSPGGTQVKKPDLDVEAKVLPVFVKRCVALPPRAATSSSLRAPRMNTPSAAAYRSHPLGQDPSKAAIAPEGTPSSSMTRTSKEPIAQKSSAVLTAPTTPAGTLRNPSFMVNCRFDVCDNEKPATSQFPSCTIAPKARAAIPATITALSRPLACRARASGRGPGKIHNT